jgi:hypothetical protein
VTDVAEKNHAYGAFLRPAIGLAHNDALDAESFISVFKTRLDKRRRAIFGQRARQHCADGLDDALLSRDAGFELRELLLRYLRAAGIDPRRN